MTANLAACNTAKQEETYVNEAIGIEFTPPAGWSYDPEEVVYAGDATNIITEFTEGLVLSDNDIFQVLRCCDFAYWEEDLSSMTPELQSRLSSSSQISIELWGKDWFEWAFSGEDSVKQEANFREEMYKDESVGYSYSYAKVSYKIGVNFKGNSNGVLLISHLGTEGDKISEQQNDYYILLGENVLLVSLFCTYEKAEELTTKLEQALVFTK